MFLSRTARFDRQLRMDVSEAITLSVASCDSTGLEPTADTVRTSAAAPREFGPYELLQELGHGGMGVVYKARQRTPARLVALKMIRAGQLASAVDLRRFAEEAQAVALLDHPSIVPIYEVGQQEGRSFYTMKLMEAGSLAQHLPRYKEHPHEAACLLVKIARAVHHAHCRGILHRDLKPSNILMDGQNQPYVADFGLARRLDAAAELTVTGELIGTPPYMAPEQLSGDKHDTTVATDVYGLGAVLYTLLGGSPPARGESVLETLRQIQEREPSALRSANPRVDRDLETICLKALKRRSEQRYASAADLADDLERYLAGLPILARPSGWLERAWLAARRHPLATALLAAALFFILLVIVGLQAHNASLAVVNDQLATSLSQSQQASLKAFAAQQRAEHSEAEAGRLLYISDMALAAQAVRDGDLRQLHDLLVRHRPAAGAVDRRGFEWHYLWRSGQVEHQQIGSHAESLYSVCYSRDDRFLATAGQDAMIRLYDARNNRQALELDSGQIEVNGLAFSPDTRLLASAGDDGTLRLWDLATGRQQRQIAAHEKQAYQVLFVPNSDLLISCGNDAVIRLWNRHSGQSLGQLIGHQRAVEAIALSPDGKTLVSASSDETARLWDLQSRSELRAMKGHRGRLTNVAFAPEGDYVATASLDKTVQLWNVATGESVFSLSGVDAFQCLAFSSSGREIVAGDRGGAISLWRRVGQQWASDAEHVRRWQAHHGRIYDVSFSPGDGAIVSAAEDGLVTLWKRPAAKSAAMVKSETAVHDMAWIADRGWLAIADELGVQVWDAATGEEVTRFSTETSCRAVAATAAGKQLAAMDAEGQIRIWNLNSRSELATWNVGQPLGLSCYLAFSPDATLLAVSAHGDNRVWLMDAATGHIEWEFSAIDCFASVFSPCGQRLAIPSQNNVLLWDVVRREFIEPLSGHSSTVNAVVYSPDGRYLASASNDRLVKVWDAATGAERFSLAGHRAEVTALAFSADSRSLISGSIDQTTRIWHVATGRPLYQLGAIGAPVYKLLFSPGGNHLASLISTYPGALVLHDTGSTEKATRPTTDRAHR